MSDHKHDENDFALNHLEEIESDTGDHDIFGTPEQQNGELFPDSAMEQDRFEPSIPAEPAVPDYDAYVADPASDNSYSADPISDGMAPENEFTDEEAIVARAGQEDEILVAPYNDDLSEEERPEAEESSLKPIIIAAVVVVVLLIFATMMFSGSDEESVSPSQVAGSSMMNDDYNDMIRRLDQKTVELEEAKRANEKLQRRVDDLEEQLTSLARVASQKLTAGNAAPATMPKPEVKPVPAPRPVEKPVSKPVVTNNSGNLPEPLVSGSVQNTPTTHSSGDWYINVVSTTSRDAALKKQRELNGAGMAAEVIDVMIKGKQWYRVRLGGFDSREAAEQQKQVLSSQHGINDAWIHKP